MDRLVLEKEAEVETKTTDGKEEDLSKQKVSETQPEIKQKTLAELVKKHEDQIEVESPQELPEDQEKPYSYVDTFEGMTLADLRKQEDERKRAEFEIEKEELRRQQFVLPEKKKNESENIIEKPNYDFIEEKKRKIKIKSKSSKKTSSRAKAASIALACTLGATALISITNSVVVDNMSSNFIEIDETYQINLRKYLKSITKLDTTKKSMQFLETYPEDGEGAGEVGKKTNWFDSLCNWLGGFFGG